MPALQSLVLTDRTPVTPVNITFVPRGKDPKGVGEVVANTGVPIGEKRCTVSMTKRGTRFIGQVRLVLPVVVTETINGVSSPVVVRTAYANLEVSFDEKSTEQERTDAIGLMSSALGTGKVLVNDALVKLEEVY
jgi:hypothetical protein